MSHTGTIRVPSASAGLSALGLGSVPAAAAPLGETSLGATLEIGAEAFVCATDADAVCLDWGKPCSPAP